MIGLWKPSASTDGQLLGRGCWKELLELPLSLFASFELNGIAFKSCFEYFSL